MKKDSSTHHCGFGKKLDIDWGVMDRWMLRLANAQGRGGDEARGKA